MHLKNLAPCWLLFDADWAHTVQSYDPINIIGYCTDIVPVGRLKWFEREDGKNTKGKDNTCWYRFDKDLAKQTVFHPKIKL